MYTESANSYIKMTNELSDLRSAMLLEQAAYCFLQEWLVSLCDNIQSDPKKTLFKGSVKQPEGIWRKNNHMSICFVKIYTNFTYGVLWYAATVIGEYFEKSSVLSIKQSFN